MPTAVAVRVVIPEVPLKFRIPVVPCVSPPVPDNAAVAVTVPLLVNATVAPVTVNNVGAFIVPLFVEEPVNNSADDDVNTPELTIVPEIVMLGIEVVVLPLIVLEVPEKVCIPVPKAEKVVALFVKFPPKV